MNEKPAFPQFFDPQRLAGSLKEVSSDLLQSETKSLVGRWFHGPRDIDLFIWTDEHGKIVKQQLTFYGQVVEWNIVEGNRTGVVIEEEMPGAAKQSEVIQFDSNVQLQPLDAAITLIGHVAALSEHEKREIITNFFRGAHMTDLGTNEFVARYGYQRPQFVALQSIAEKLKKFLRWLFKPLA